jgi:ferric-dicitrate binding protein FerR (iron transport regulator)
MKRRVQFLIRQAAAPDDRYDADEGWERVKNKRFTLRRRAIRRRALGYAAAIAAITATIYFQQPGGRGAGDDSPATDPARITLLLANGERVVWGDDGQYSRDAGQQLRVEELGVTISSDGDGRLMRYDADTANAARHASADTGMNLLIVPRGCELPVQLPDGSVVWLNSGSALRFPVAFPRGNRTVFLEGEGYFDVARDESSPFRVISGEKIVTVLGTRFNVSAYADDPTWSVTLVEGSVSVLVDGRESLLEPSRQFVHGEGGSRVDVVETETYTAWTRGQVYFKLSPLEEIVRKLERWYDFTITYEDDALRRARFRGGINKYRPLEETLRYLEETGEVRFTINGRHVSAARPAGAKR